MDDPRPGEPSKGRQRFRAPHPVAVAVGIALLGAGAWFTLGSSDDPSPEEVVEAFFEAQRRRDCGTLVDLVSEATWSDGGNLTRPDFHLLCDEVVARNRNDVTEVGGTVEVDDDRALVEVDIRVDGEPVESPYVAVVREDGRWRVQPREDIQLGRSPQAILDAYLIAYARGDCDALVDILDPATWSEGGNRTRDGFLADCDARTGLFVPLIGTDPGRWLPEEGAGWNPDGRDTMAFTVPSIGSEERVSDPGLESRVTFVIGGLEPRVRHPDGEPPAAVANVELMNQLVAPDHVRFTEAGRLNRGDAHGGLVALVSGAGRGPGASELEELAGFVHGVRGAYDDEPRNPRRHLAVTVLVFETDDDARAHVDGLTDLLRASDRMQGEREVGLPEAAAYRFDDGSGAVALVAHERMAIRVQSSLADADEEVDPVTWAADTLEQQVKMF